MVQLSMIVRLVLLATLKTSECSYNGLGGMPQNRGMSRMPLSEERSSDKGFVPYRGSIPNLYLSSMNYQRYNYAKCTQVGPRASMHFWSLEDCVMGTLFAPVCRVESANESDYMIRENYLTDGSPSNPTRGLNGKNKFISMPNVAFRVMTPTIPEFPEFTTEIAFNSAALKIETSIQAGKIFVFPKHGGIVATDDSILVDPSCHTNNACGVAFLTTSVKAVKTPHVAMDENCGQTIDLKLTRVLNVFSHAGIGCKLFDEVYTTPNCELTITSNSAITANVTLVNFRKTTCKGYELKFVNFTCEGVSKEIDVCQENAPMVFNSSDGKMQIKLTGSASENWPRYGFIIRLERDLKKVDFSQCSYENSVQGATDDFPQVSSTGPAESSTNSPVQGATDDIPQVPTTGPAESPTNSPVQGATEDFPQVSTTVAAESPNNSPIQGAADDFTQVSTTGSAESPTNSPVQGETDDFTQVSTTGHAESPTNNPVQSPIDGSDVDLPEASLESSSATEFIRDPTESFVSGSPSISHKRPTNPHHLHMLLALGIEL